MQDDKLLIQQVQEKVADCDRKLNELTRARQTVLAEKCKYKKVLRTLNGAIGKEE